MTRPTRPGRLTRIERLTLANAAIRGLLAGVARALVDWIIGLTTS
jgi:hypothetical protein